MPEYQIVRLRNIGRKQERWRNEGSPYVEKVGPEYVSIVAVSAEDKCSTLRMDVPVSEAKQFSVGDVIEIRNVTDVTLVT